MSATSERAPKAFIYIQLLALGSRVTSVYIKRQSAPFIYSLPVPVEPKRAPEAFIYIQLLALEARVISQVGAVAKSATLPTRLMPVASFRALSAFNDYGYSLFSSLGNGIVSLTCSTPEIHATVRSRPSPKPECGTAPYLDSSRYHS